MWVLGDRFVSMHDAPRSTAAVILPGSALEDLAAEPKPLGGTTGSSFAPQATGRSSKNLSATGRSSNATGTMSNANATGMSALIADAGALLAAKTGTAAGVILERKVKKQSAVHTVFAYLAAVEKHWPRAVASIDLQVRRGILRVQSVVELHDGLHPEDSTTDLQIDRRHRARPMLLHRS